MLGHWNTVWDCCWGVTGYPIQQPDSNKSAGQTSASGTEAGQRQDETNKLGNEAKKHESK